MTQIENIRREFEEWLINQGVNTQYIATIKGEYIYPVVSYRWEGWQAAYQARDKFYEQKELK